MRICFGMTMVLAAFSARLIAQDSSVILGKSYVQVGFNGYTYNYSEIWDAKTSGTLGITRWTGTPKSNETGFTPMFHLAGKLYSKTLPLTGGFLLDYGGGKHSYDGATQAFDTSTKTAIYTPMTGSSDNTFARLGVYGGPCFQQRDYLVGIHAGILWYYWYRNTYGSNSTESTPEKYNWFYLPIGVETSFRIGNTMSIGCNIDYRIMVMGSMTVDFSSVTIGTPYSVESPTLNLGTRNGFLIEVPYQVDLDRNYSVELKPWIELRPSGVSNIDTMKIMDSFGGVAKGPVLEPGSNSYSIGLTLSLNFGKLSFYPERRRGQL